MNKYPFLKQNEKFWMIQKNFLGHCLVWAVLIIVILGIYNIAMLPKEFKKGIMPGIYEIHNKQKYIENNYIEMKLMMCGLYPNIDTKNCQSILLKNRKDFYDTTSSR